MARTRCGRSVPVSRERCWPRLQTESLLVTLSGELGAGKTTLVGGLLAELGHVGPARSPTYTLLEPYRLQGRDITHCDLYRLRHPDELDDLGLRDLRVAGSVLLVEWPEKAEGRLERSRSGADVRLRRPGCAQARCSGALTGGPGRARAALTARDKHPVSS